MGTRTLLVLLLLLIGGSTLARTAEEKAARSARKEERKAAREALRNALEDAVKLEQERILAYHVEVEVDTTAWITVTEHIRVHALGQRIERGIYRTLPAYRYINGQERAIRYPVLEVTRDGRPEPYHSAEGGDGTTIYIGNPDVRLPKGTYTYTLRYRCLHQIGFFEGYDELYWNVNGNGWLFPVDSISATVHLPPGATILQAACYTGVARSEERNCAQDTLPGNRITWHASTLDPGEGLTIAVGFSSGMIKRPLPPLWLRPQRMGALLGAAFALLLAWLGLLWYRHGIDPRMPTVVPLFAPPSGSTPASMGYLARGHYRTDLLVATLVDLAVRGAVKIVRTRAPGRFKQAHYGLFKLEERMDLAGPEANQLLRDLFPGTRTSFSITGGYDTHVAHALGNHRDALNARMGPLVKEGHNRKRTVLPLLFLISAFVTVSGLAHFHLYDPSRLWDSIGLLALHLLLFGLFLGLKRISKRIGRWGWLLPAGILAYGLHGGITHAVEPDAFTLGMLFLSAGFTALTAFGHLIERPGKRFLAERAKMEGFRMYLGAAEEEWMRFHNPPEITPETFERYLPYAIAFGVDAIWGERFERVLERSSVTYESKWYSGSDRRMSDMRGPLRSSLSSSFGAASISSSSSSSSGSSGGGSSGGGGGGGGGGGW